MFRNCLLLCVYLLSAVPATLLAKPKEAPTSPRAYIETSYLIAPRTVGPFSLARRAYDPDAKAAGAAFHYAMPGQPDLSIDVFVYPLGQRDQTQAIAEGMAAFRKDLASAVTQGSYSRLDELDQTTLVLPTNDAPANGRDAKVIAAIADAQRVVGEKLRLRTQLSSTGKPMRSNGYLFYKQLYYFKVCVCLRTRTLWLRTLSSRWRTKPHVPLFQQFRSPASAAAPRQAFASTLTPHLRNRPWH
ncbi:hypothetical protein NY751_04335 [Xanthomonas campestris]|uniref:hypothetical protein n=1 Tax=Xanthomonas campestris TaxID=339 RepID=UPI0023585259|nr:hypothetical protein [Xanthomonas campestris]MDC8745328.1 hypothetical protein [Xanthomonas campestris]